MFGQPYAIERLDPSLRGPEVARLFGRMHLGLYLHTSQMVRRGFAGPLDAPDAIDAAGRFGDLDPTWFAGKRVTLLAAGQDQTWHRESIDLMYEWLRNNAGAVDRHRYRKHVFPITGCRSCCGASEPRSTSSRSLQLPSRRIRTAWLAQAAILPMAALDNLTPVAVRLLRGQRSLASVEPLASAGNAHRRQLVPQSSRVRVTVHW
jgi:hypothetical protein